jgi:membrane fusion protein, multidrug efflux system
MTVKHFNMNTIKKIAGLALIVVLAAACGSDAQEKQARGSDKNAQLQQLKEQQTKLNTQVRQMEEELAKTDTSAASAVNAKLVVLKAVATEKFTHYIDLQGKVDAENIGYVTPRGAGGQVKAIYVKQGDRVRKGQLLMKLDDAVTSQQIEQVKIQLDLAETLYSRRKKLWDQKIGTEVELLQAKNNVDNLNKQVSLLEEQLSMSNIYAPISGVADIVNIKMGEYFSAQTATVLGIRIVNTSTLKVVAQVPENYLGKVQEGSAVMISLPGSDKVVKSKVKVKGSTIDANSRSFYIEASIPASLNFRPNQIAIVKIQDYTSPNAVTIPMNTLQTDDKGKYVFVAVNENGKKLAKKKPIVVGELYGNDLEVKSGLTTSDTLILEGFQGLYDGQLVMTSENL